MIFTDPLIQVVLAVVELLGLRLPHELHVDLRVELPTLGQLQLKHTHRHEHSGYTQPFITCIKNTFPSLLTV